MIKTYQVTFELEILNGKGVKQWELTAKCPDLCNNVWQVKFNNINNITERKNQLVKMFQAVIPLNITSDGKILETGTLVIPEENNGSEESPSEIL